MDTMIFLACAGTDVLTFRALYCTLLPRRGRLHLLCLCGLWALLSPLPFLMQPDITALILQFFLYFCSSFLAFRGKWWLHLLAALVSTALPWLSVNVLLQGTAAFFSIRTVELTLRRQNYLVILLTGHFFALLIAWLIRRLQMPEGRKLSQLKWSLLALVLPLVSLVMLGVIFLAHLGRNDLSELAFFSCCVLIAANTAMLFLLEAIEASTKKRQEMALLSQQLQIQTESIWALEKSYRTQRQATHDFQRHLQALATLLSAGENQAALEYVQQLQGLQTTRIFSINSHHPIVDAVLNQKHQAAREQEIEVQMQVNNLSQVPLELSRLVVLLSNLLDNAIEACLRLPSERVIRCNILLQERLFLSVSNTSAPVTLVDGQLSTVKTDQMEHGYGLATVCRILKQYGAEYIFDYTEGWFHFAAEIPLSDYDAQR